MAEKTKAELQKEAEALGAEVAPDATKPELRAAVEQAQGGPNVYEARFDPANPPKK